MQNNTDESGTQTATAPTATSQTKNEKFEKEKKEYFEILSAKKHFNRELKQFRIWLDSALTSREAEECEKEAERQEQEKNNERYFSFASSWANEWNRAENKKAGFERQEEHAQKRQEKVAAN